ncbi:hypothetical protein F4777DRAFT_557511 [Nemania sp. FL0916]|nr:hypothetical protein F4777DRAFT_557511 [Nemania sp. FL0916]
MRCIAWDLLYYEPRNQQGEYEGLGKPTGLDDFLRAADVSECEFPIERQTSTTMLHIAYQLPKTMFKIEQDKRKGTVKIFKIPGAEFEHDLRIYKKKVAEFEKGFEMLRNEYMKELLGDAVYRELVLLETVKHSKAADELTASVVAGTKRPADDTFCTTNRGIEFLSKGSAAGACKRRDIKRREKIERTRRFFS